MTAEYRKEICESIRSKQFDMLVMRVVVLEVSGMMDDLCDKLCLLTDLADPERVGEVMKKMSGVIVAVNLAQSLDPAVEKRMSWLSSELDLHTDVSYIKSAQKVLFEKLVAADRIDVDIPGLLLNVRYGEVLEMIEDFH